MSLLLDALHKARQEQEQQGNENQAAADTAAERVDEASTADQASVDTADLTLDIDTADTDTDPAVVEAEASGEQLSSLAQQTQTTDAYIARVEQQLAAAETQDIRSDENLAGQADHASGDAGLSLVEGQATGLKPANIAAAEPQVSPSILNDFENDRQQQHKRKLLVGGGTSIAVLLLLFTVIDWSQLTTGNAATSFAQPVADISFDDPQTTGTDAPESTTASPVAETPVADNTVAAGSTPVPAPVDTSAANTADTSSSRATIVNGIEPVNQPVTGPATNPAATPAVAAADQQTIRISKRRSSTRLQSALNDAYLLYSAGRIDEASAAYAAIERSHPANTDALNGLGATALARGEQRLAQRYFYDALAADPNNVYARAALLTTLQKMSPGDREVELKQVIAQNPDNAFANFALGSFYAEQQNWHAAQQAYFEAHRAEPVNAEYSYNLAVALDHLGKPEAATTYYQRTLALSRDNESALPLAAVQARIASLRPASATEQN